MLPYFTFYSFEKGVMKAVEAYDRAVSHNSLPGEENFNNIQLASISKNKAICYRKLMENLQFDDFHQQRQLY